jgi:hypothetical protein
VGSTPIGSTNLFKGLDIVRPLETFPGLLIVRILSECFSLPGGLSSGVVFGEFVERETISSCFVSSLELISPLS